MRIESFEAILFRFRKQQYLVIIHNSHQAMFGLHTFVTGGSGRAGNRGRMSHPGPKFLHFRALFGKNWVKKYVGAPPLPLGNSGSATVCDHESVFGLVTFVIVKVCLDLLVFPCIVTLKASGLQRRRLHWRCLCLSYADTLESNHTTIILEGQSEWAIETLL